MRWARRAVMVAAMAAMSTGCATGNRAVGPLAVISTRTASSTWSEAIGPRIVVRADVAPDELAGMAAEIEGMIDVLEAVAFEFAERPTDRVGIMLFTRREEYWIGADELSMGHFQELWEPGVEVPASIFVPGKWNDQRRAVVRHELTHRYVRHYYPAAPRWLDEGLATFFQTLSVEDGVVTLGTARRAGTGKSRIPSFRALKAMTPWDFSVVDESMNEYDRSLAVDANYHASWLVVHFLMTGGEEWRKRFDAYLLALSRGEPDQAAWDAAFSGLNAEEIQTAMLAHHDRMLIPALRTQVSLPAPPRIETRALRLAEIDVLRAWYRDWEGDGIARATAELERAIRSEPDLAEAYVWRGHIARDGKRYDAAREDYRRARTLAPRSTAAMVAELDLALADVTSGRRAESAALIDGALNDLAKVARTPLALDTVARALLHRGKAGAALGFAKRATEMSLGCVPCWSTRANVSAALGQKSAAVAALDVAIRQSVSEAQRKSLAARREALAAP